VGRAELRHGTVGMIFQQLYPIPSLTVAASIAFQARLAGRHGPVLVQSRAVVLNPLAFGHDRTRQTGTPTLRSNSNRGIKLRRFCTGTRILPSIFRSRRKLADQMP